MIDEETVRRLIAVELGEGEVHSINIKYDKPQTKQNMLEAVLTFITRKNHSHIVLVPSKAIVFFWKLSDDETYNLSFDADLLNNVETDTVFDELVKPMSIKLKTFRAKKLAANVEGK